MEHARSTKAPEPAYVNAMRDVLLSSDPDRVARHLGLTHGEAATQLLGNGAALTRLSERLADGTRGLNLDDARALATSWIGGRKDG